MQFARKHVRPGQYLMDIQLNIVYFIMSEYVLLYFSFRLGTGVEGRDGSTGAGVELGRAWQVAGKGLGVGWNCRVP